MHDCPVCRVPLHGHEEVCPSCGTRQYVTKGYRQPVAGMPADTGPGPVPFIVGFVILAIGAFVVINFTWVGELMKGPPPEDPMAKLTYMDARNIIETEIQKNLAAVGAEGKFTWTAAGAPADKTVDQPVELAIETKLSDPQQRREIIDPIKDYMEKAKIPVLTMTDTRSNATWTYTVSAPAAAPDAAAGGE